MRSNSFLLSAMIITLIFVPRLSYGWNFPDDFSFVGLEKMAKDIKKSVFAVQTEGNLQNEDKADDYISLGTGFLLSKNNIVIGLTCAHVIKSAITNNKPILIGLNTAKGFQRFKCAIALNDQNMDLAILIPQKPMATDQIELMNLVLDGKYLAGEEEIAEGRGIIIPGYPLGLGLEHDENHPIIKFGIVAQHAGETHFLVDGVANPGNSGSPVFDLKAAKFIGMVQSYKPDFIQLFDQRGQLSASFPYNSGLSSVLSAAVISKALEKVQLK